MDCTEAAVVEVPDSIHGGEALRQEINGAIAKILADGTYKKLAGKYFSFDVYSGT